MSVPFKLDLGTLFCYFILGGADNTSYKCIFSIFKLLMDEDFPIRSAFKPQSKSIKFVTQRIRVSSAHELPI